MTIHTFRARFLAACESAALVLTPWRKRDIEKQAHKADLRDWENEGGNLAPLPEASGTVPAGKAGPPVALACTPETIRLNRFAVSRSGPT
jgi:hypothetical protein